MFIIKSTKSKIIMQLLFVFISIFCMFTYSHADRNDFNTVLDAKKAILLDSNTGSILYSKNPDSRIYPASTCKVLTAIIAIENSNLDEIITISDNALKGQEKGGSHIALLKGEKITMRDALNGLLLASGNDCAIAIAEHVGKSTNGFAKLMNDKAKELGLKNSHFLNPHGLFDKNHYSTARDLALVTSHALKNPKFRNIISNIEYVIPSTNKHSEPTTIHNNHKMTKYKIREYPGIIGGKRGYIHESGFNLITAARRKNMTLVAVVASGSSLVTNCEDTKKLLDTGFVHYKNLKLNYDALIRKVELPFEKSKVVGRDILTTVKNNVKIENIKIRIEKNTSFKNTIKKGQPIGRLIATENNRFIGSSILFAAQNIYPPFSFNIFKIFKILVIPLCIFIALILFFIFGYNKKGESR